MRRILAIDDNQSILDFLEMALGAHHFRVTTCKNPTKALNLVKEKRFDAIILDYFMPRLNGELFLKLLNVRGIPVPRVIILSGGPMEELSRRLSDKGICRFMAKPFSIDDLLMTLDGISGARLDTCA
jgi:two-component system alkaline phosphatase synthesis response regulator PhoP